MFFHTFLLVFMAEMADKTQFMMMSYSKNHSFKTIIIGLLIGVLGISLFSVLLGSVIGTYIPISLIKIFAGILFIFFGFRSLLPEKSEEEAGISSHKYIILTIATTFAFCELGDKTQLATVAMSANNTNQIMAILCGSALGLILANLIGITVGKILFAKISLSTLQICSSFCFLLFGSLTIFELINATNYMCIAYSCSLCYVAYLFYERHKT